MGTGGQTRTFVLGCSSNYSQIFEKAAEFNSQRCFEFLIMNGVEVDQEILIAFIKGGNMAIIKQCFDGIAKVSTKKKSWMDNCGGNYFINTALDYRRLEVAEWLLESVLEKGTPFYICPLSLFGYCYLPISAVSKYICPTVVNLAKIEEKSTEIGGMDVIAAVCYALDCAVESGFPDSVSARRSNLSDERIKNTVPDIAESLLFDF